MHNNENFLKSLIKNEFYNNILTIQTKLYAMKSLHVLAAFNSASIHEEIHSQKQLLKALKTIMTISCRMGISKDQNFIT